MEKYFDYAAATPVSTEVLDAMSAYFSNIFHNPSALYTGATDAKSALNEARKQVATALHVTSGEIVFTSGCTESNNLAIHGVMQQFPTKKVLISAAEHDAVRMPAGTYDVDYIPVDKNGCVKLDALESMLDDDVVLVSTIYVHNEVGSVQPLRKIAKLVEKKRQLRGTQGLPLYFHADAAQAPNTEVVAPVSLGVDLMSLSGAKIYGPKGVGCLYVKKGISLKPLVYGGGQERGLRSGTENVPLIVGFAHALSVAIAHHPEERGRLAALNQRLCSGIEALGGKVIVEGTASISSVLFKGRDNEYLVYALDALGTSVASGSACHAGSAYSSHVLRALGIDEVSAKGVLRFSLGRQTTVHSIDLLLKDLQVVLANN